MPLPAAEGESQESRCRNFCSSENTSVLFGNLYCKSFYSKLQLYQISRQCDVIQIHDDRRDATSTDRKFNRPPLNRGIGRREFRSHCIALRFGTVMLTIGPCALLNFKRTGGFPSLQKFLHLATVLRVRSAGHRPDIVRTANLFTDSGADNLQRLRSQFLEPWLQ
jgi:hypothetical protein